MMVSHPPTAAMAPTLITKSGSGENCVHRYGPYDPTPHLLSRQLVDSRSWRDGAIAFVAPVKSKLPGAYFTKRGCLMVHDTTVERVTNRVWASSPLSSTALPRITIAGRYLERTSLRLPS